MNNLEFCYRVREEADGSYIVHVMFPPPHIGTTGWKRMYKTFESLPQLLRERILALHMVDPKDGEEVKGAGRRMASVPPTYWISTTEEAIDGTDSGRQG
jgi:predicted component of type VI protein secretion system